MATRSTRTNAQSRGNAAPTRQRRQAQEEAPAQRRTRRAAPAAQQPAGRDLSIYQDYEPTAYHKAFATWLVKEVGVKISSFETTKEAFLQGVALATAARPAFNDSEFLEAWREKTGVAKRGPKPKVEEPEDEDFEDEDESDEIDEEDDDDDFEDDDDESDEEDDDEGFDDEDEEPEQAPVKRGPGRTRKAAPTAVEPAPRRGRSAAKAAPAKAAPAKATRARASKSSDDFVF